MAALRILRCAFKHLLPSLMVVALLFAALAVDSGAAGGNGEFIEIPQVSTLSTDLSGDPGDYDPPVVAITPVQVFPVQRAGLPFPLSVPAIQAIYTPLPRPPWTGQTDSQQIA